MGKPALFLIATLLLSAEGTSAVAQQKETPLPLSLRAKPADTKPADTEAANLVLGYTAWDENFLYFAIQVNKPTLNGKNSQPFSHPLEDDAVIVSLQTDDDHAAMKPTAHTYLIAVSAAGGAQLYSGPDKTPLFTSFTDFQDRLQDILQNEKDPTKQEARRNALLGSVLKYQALPKGTQRETGTFHAGYTVELAVPWTDLGGKPALGSKMGVNIAAQSTIPSSPPLQSLSPQVQTSRDIENPSLWGEILFSASAKLTQGNFLTCPHVLTAPVIDGEVGNGEWIGLSSFVFGERAAGNANSVVRTVSARVQPAFMPQPARPVVPLSDNNAEDDAPSAQKLEAHSAQVVPRLVMARYEYDYQADSRKAAPTGHVFYGNGGSALAHHPLEGVGPWLSYDRADWHRHQLQDARQAGVDVLLPVYRGSALDRKGYADKGLSVLTTALQSLAQSGQDYPQIAMYLDASSVTESAGAKPDMHEPATQAALYAMIRDFYRHIPAAFRCSLSLNARNGGRTAYPVFIAGADAFSDIDPAFVAYARKHFMKDFDGADLVILGESEFKSKMPLDGYFTETKDKGFQFETSGWIKVGSVGPGYDGSMIASQGQNVPLRLRRNGDTYRADWMAAISRQPDWVLLDGWNDYSTASEIAPTLETGYSTTDITKEYIRRFAGLTKVSARLLRQDAPRQMVAGQTYQIDVRAQNTGIEPWGAAAAALPTAFAYRWRRGEQIVATGIGAAIVTPTLPGQNMTASLPVRATAAGGSPLPDGDYTLEIGVVEQPKHGPSGTFIGSNATGATVQTPVTVFAGSSKPTASTQNTASQVIEIKSTETKPKAWAATLLSSDLPTMLEVGSVYRIQATLRNDGYATWRKADGARVTLRLYRTTSGKEAAAGKLEEVPVASADATALLTQDVPPGQTANVHIDLPLTDPTGAPLPAWKQDEDWTYTARWEVATDSVDKSVDKTVTTGTSIAPMPVAVVNYDFGVRFLADGTPATLPAERRLPMRLSVQNVGPQTWKHDEVRIGYHWYYQDGTEYVFDDETTPITQDVAPGGRVDDMLVWLTAPACDGLYYLVWDVKVGDVWASTTASTRAFDQVVRPIQVINGRLTFLDLSKAYNLDGTSDDNNMRGGDFDGQGRSFPAELTPPYASGGAVSSGIWTPTTHTGPDSPRRISFRWGPKDSKEKNFIVCRGQRVDLGKDGAKCRYLHILAASTGKDISTNIKLIYQEPTSESEDLYALTVKRWDQLPTSPDAIAFMTRRHNETRGAQNNPVALYHYRVKIRDPRQLIAVVLPNAPEIKIAAMTAEK